MGSGLVVVGVDIGQKVDPSAVAVVEEERRVIEPAREEVRPVPGRLHAVETVTIPAKTEPVYVARHLGRLPLGTPYPKVAEHVAGVVTALVARGIPRPRLIVDATGVGQPVVDILREALGQRGRAVVAATFTHGDRYSQDNTAHVASVGKAHLVSRLQALLQTGRLKLPRTAEADVLARELEEYEIRVDEDANDKYGAFKVGSHDDLVTALGLALVYREPPEIPRRSPTVSYYEETPGRYVAAAGLRDDW